MSNSLRISGLSAGYGAMPVLDDVSLEVAEESITAVIGSNGAGKTTLMRAVMGLIPATAGAVVLGGEDITAAATSRRVALGLSLVPEGRLVFPDLSVEETLRIGAYVDRARPQAELSAERVYELFPPLRERRRQKAGTLSGGEQQMLALGRALMSCPHVLLLDEPSLGLAPGMARRLFAAAGRLRDEGMTICIVEQDVYATLQIADYAYVLENGRVVRQGRSAELRDLPMIKESFLGL